VARLGGDEFAVLLDRCTVEQAAAVAQKLCDRMEDFRFTHGGQRFRLGTSIGLVPVDGRWQDISGIMQAADACCYAAKEEGRNRVHVWSDRDQAVTARHGEAQWAGKLAQALDDDLFVLFAQKIHRLHAAPHDAQGVHAEVLLRMVGTDGKLYAPGAFLPAAERFHMISRIDRWVLDRAIGWMNALPDPCVIDMLAVNISGQSIGDAAFQIWVINRLADAGPRICHRLCLEITETAVVTSLTDAARFIEQVRRAGVRVALDDFGAGASSFGYLKSLQVDYLKIDGQFVSNLISDALDEAAVRSFVDVAGVIGLRTIAEFVACEERLTH
jgi:EAL domain-containing protein (putative c-di-GMP-specific phosphodiesterase class I)